MSSQQPKQSWASITAKQLPGANQPASNAQSIPAQSNGASSQKPSTPPNVSVENQQDAAENVKFDQKVLSKGSSSRVDPSIQFGSSEKEETSQTEGIEKNVPVPSNPPIPGQGPFSPTMTGPRPPPGVRPPGMAPGRKGQVMPVMGQVPWQYGGYDPNYYPSYPYPAQYMNNPGFAVRPGQNPPAAQTGNRPILSSPVLVQPSTTTPNPGALPAQGVSPILPSSNFTLPAATRKPVAIKIIDPTTGKPLDLASIKESTKKETDKPAEKPTASPSLAPAPIKSEEKSPVVVEAKATSPEPTTVTLPVRESKAIPIRRPDEIKEEVVAPPILKEEPKEQVKEPVKETLEKPDEPMEEAKEDEMAEDDGYEFEIESSDEYEALDDEVPDVDVEGEATDDFQDILAAKLNSLHIADVKSALDKEISVSVSDDHPEPDQKSPTSATFKARAPVDLKKLEIKKPASGKVYFKPSKFEEVKYPEGIKVPCKVDNVLKYDKEFLLAFLAIEKWDYPVGLPPKEQIFDEGLASARSPAGTPTSARGKGGMLSRSNLSSRQLSATDVNSPLSRTPSGGINMAKLSAEERYQMSKGKGFASTRGAPLGQTGRSFSGVNEGLGPRSGSTAKSARGKGRGAPKSRKELEMEKQFTIPEDQLKPLETSESAWVAQLRKKASEDDLDEEARQRLHEDEVRKALQGLLNKLSLERFESLSDKILALDVSSPSMLKLVIYGVYDKAVDEPNFGPMYARLCAKMSTKLPELHPWIVEAEGQGKNNLFRRILLNKCQEEFEKGSNWAEIGSNRPAVDPSTLSAEERQALADEDELRQKLKRRALGNIKFIGELFKLGMLTEKIMHTCITQLLMESVKAYIPKQKGDEKEVPPEDVRTSAEEELESLCKLMTTVGKKLDHAKAAKIMDAYFAEMLKLSKIPAIPSRIRFALQDVVDLRDDEWVARSNVTPAGPKTIAEIRKEAEKAQQEASRLGGRQGSRGMSGPSFSGVGSRGASGMGQRTESRKEKSRFGSSNLGPKGWSQSKESSAGRISPVNGDRAPSPRPSSAAGQSARAATPSGGVNMFSALNDIKDEPVEVLEPEHKPKMDREKAERKMENMIAEFFASSNIDEFLATWKEFDGQDHDDDVLDKFLTHIFDIKEGDPRISSGGDAIVRAQKENVVSTDTILAALLRQSEVLEDLVSDIPKIFSIFGTITARILAGGAIESSSLLDIAQPLIDSPSRVPSAPKLVKAIFTELKRDSPDTAVELWKSSQIELPSFFPSSYDAEKIQEWLKDAELQDVLA